MLLDKAKIKLAILAVYDAVAVEVNPNAIQESIISTGEVAVFDYQDSFSELIEQGLLHYAKLGNEILCGISQQGSLMFSEGSSLLGKEVCDKIISQSIRHFEEILSGRHYDVVLCEVEGGYEVTCSLVSDTKVFMEAKLFFDNIKDAEEAQIYCKRKPESIYSGLETLMTGKIAHLL